MARKPKSTRVASTSKLDKPTAALSTVTATAGLLSDSASDSESGAGSSSSASPSSSSKGKKKNKNKFKDRLSLNQSFATSYKLKKQTEELSKLQDKYGAKLDQLSANDEEDSEASTVYSDDDSDAELVTPQVDVAIFKTLAKIRNKDPEVYEPQKMVFEEEEKGLASTSGTASTKPKASSSKPVLLKDYQLQRMLADPTHSQIDDESIPDASFQPPTYAQQEQALKEQVKQAFFQANGSDDQDDGDDDDAFLVKRTQTKDEAQKEQDEYTQFLKTNMGAKAVKEALHEEEEFLNESVCTDLFSGIHLKADSETRSLSYLLHRGWIDPKAKKNRIPSYKEITGGNDDSDDEIEHVQSLAKDGKKARQLLAESIKAAALKAERAEGEEEEDETRLNPGLHDSSDSEFEEQAEEFEHKYNFRFEEAQGADLITHSRTAMSSLRKPTTATTARQRAREAAKTKKEQEKLERKEEVRRLKALKRKEVEAKLAKLIEAAGEGTKGLDAIDLDGDWDEAEHDRKMQEIYGEDYDQGDDEGFKPTWDDDIDIGDIAEVGDDELGFARGGEDGDEAMEGDYDEDDDEDDEDGEGSGNKKSKRQARREARKKRKGRDEEGLPVELLEAARQGGDEARKRVVDAMVDDYYALDYEDKVGDIATRFKYAKVEPTGYNLTAEEILLATDAELNQFMSLKKLAPYRRSDEEKVKASKQKKRLKELRDLIKARKWGDELPADGDEPPRKRKKYSQETGGSTSKEGGAPKKEKRAGKSERKRKGKSAGTSEAGDDAE